MGSADLMEVMCPHITSAELKAWVTLCKGHGRKGQFHLAELAEALQERPLKLHFEEKQALPTPQRWPRHEAWAWSGGSWEAFGAGNMHNHLRTMRKQQSPWRSAMERSAGFCSLRSILWK